MARSSSEPDESTYLREREPHAPDVTSLKESQAEAARLRSDLASQAEHLSELSERAAGLSRISEALTRATTLEQIAEAVTSGSAALFGARASALYLLENGGDLRQLAALGGAEQSLRDGRVCFHDGQPLSHAVRSGQPLWLGTRAQLCAAHPELAAHAFDGEPLVGLAALPLQDARTIYGGLLCLFAAPQPFDETQRGLYMTLAAQAAQAIRRTLSLAAERKARQDLQRQRERLALLSEASEAFVSMLDSRHALAELARRIVRTVADWCAVDELAPDGAIRRLVIEHRDPSKVALAQQLADRYPDDPQAPHGVPAVLRSGRTEWVPHISDELLVASARDPEHLALVRSLGLTSYAVVPLVVRGRVLGALSLVSEGERQLREEDLRFAEDLARRAALALDNARLYEAAESARARLSELFMQAPAAIALLRGPELRFVLANAPYQQRFGARPLLGRAFREALPELAAQGLAAQLERVYASGETYTSFEQPLELDELRYFNIVHQPTRAANGAVEGVVSYAFEVSEQVRARGRMQALDREIARNEARLRALVDATAAIVWTTAPSGELVELSSSWQKFTGQSPAQYRGYGFAEAIHPDDRAHVLAAWAQATGSAAPFAAEYRLRRADGSYAHTLARGTPVRDEQGHVREYVGCNVDISEQRRAEASAREHALTLAQLNELGRVISAELDLRKLVQAVTDAATLLTGAKFGAFFYNAVDEHGESYALYTLSGVARDAFAGFPMPRKTAVFGPTFDGQGVVRAADITEDPRYGQSPPHHGMPAGHLPLRSYLAVPVVSRLGNVLGGIFLGHPERGVFGEDSERLVVAIAAQAAIAMDNARLFSEAEQLIQKLEQTNRELDQFAYVTSHDLKAPLRGIGSLAEWIEEDLGEAVTPEARKKLEMLRGRVRRMEALIEGILQFSRAGRSVATSEELELGKLVSELAELLAPTPPARVLVEPDPPAIRAERLALSQVLMNLIGNGLKHAGRADAEVRVSARDGGEAWEFCITDNGPGIAPEYHERIWGMFQTLSARDRVENTGIGLAIVKKVVESRGGRCWLVSQPSQGASFYFSWPKRDERRT